MLMEMTSTQGGDKDSEKIQIKALDNDQQPTMIITGRMCSYDTVFGLMFAVLSNILDMYFIVKCVHINN